jgi:hypothetical protein
MWGRRNPHTLLVGMLITLTTIENGIEAPQKTKTRTATQSTNATPKYVSKGIQVRLQ